MPSYTHKVLGQALPNGSSVDLYTVPAGKELVASTLHVTNVTGAATTFTIWIRKDGAAAADAQKLAHLIPLTANQILPVTTGITADAGDVITVASGVSNSVAFSLFGAEVTP